MVDLCSIDPGFDVDLRVATDLRTMTAIWMGLTDIQAEAERGQVQVAGDPRLARSMQTWLGLSPFARGEEARRRLERRPACVTV